MFLKLRLYTNLKKNKRQLIVLSIVVTFCIIICSNVSYILQLLKHKKIKKSYKRAMVIKAYNFTAKEFTKSRFSRLPSINQHQIYLYIFSSLFHHNFIIAVEE